MLSSQLYYCGRGGDWLLGDDSVSLLNISITSFDPYNNPTMLALYVLWSPFYWWENWHIERLSDWAVKKQWVRSSVRTWNQAFWYHGGERNILFVMWLTAQFSNRRTWPLNHSNVHWTPTLCQGLLGGSWPDVQLLWAGCLSGKCQLQV